MIGDELDKEVRQDPCSLQKLTTEFWYRLVYNHKYLDIFDQFVGFTGSGSERLVEHMQLHFKNILFLDLPITPQDGASTFELVIECKDLEDQHEKTLELMNEKRLKVPIIYHDDTFKGNQKAKHWLKEVNGLTLN